MDDTRGLIVTARKAFGETEIACEVCGLRLGTNAHPTWPDGQVLVTLSNGVQVFLCDPCVGDIRYATGPTTGKQYPRGLSL